MAKIYRFYLMKTIKYTKIIKSFLSFVFSPFFFLGFETEMNFHSLFGKETIIHVDLIKVIRHLNS